jgi:hypothetical protein
MDCGLNHGLSRARYFLSEIQLVQNNPLGGRKSIRKECTCAERERERASRKYEVRSKNDKGVDIRCRR